MRRQHVMFCPVALLVSFTRKLMHCPLGCAGDTLPRSDMLKHCHGLARTMALTRLKMASAGCASRDPLPLNLFERAPRFGSGWASRQREVLASQDQHGTRTLMQRDLRLGDELLMPYALS